MARSNKPWFQPWSRIAKWNCPAGSADNRMLYLRRLHLEFGWRALNCSNRLGFPNVFTKHSLVPLGYFPFSEIMGRGMLNILPVEESDTTNSCNKILCLHKYTKWVNISRVYQNRLVLTRMKVIVMVIMVMERVPQRDILLYVYIPDPIGIYSYIFTLPI